MAKMKYRKYCKTCNDYQVFDETETDELICSVCNLKLEPVELTDIPNDKILEQRQRYKDNYISNFMDNLKSRDSILVKQEIVMEDDAGLMLDNEFSKTSIDILGKELATYREQKQQQIFSRNKIGRNHTCYCGSGKKFKHCCLLK